MSKTLSNRGKVYWFTGLSGAGKSTLGRALGKHLLAKGKYVKILDGDEIRKGLCNDLGFSKADRHENIRRVSEVAKMFSDNGIIAICCFISPTNESRKMARNIIGDSFVEIYVNTPIEVCEDRDVKGLYVKARKGEIKNFTGVSDPYETPVRADFTVFTVNQNVESSLDSLINSLGI